jgi:hypothetical protein
MVKMGISRRIEDKKGLREGRDLMMFFPWKGKPPRKKEGMFTWILQEHMYIMMHH